MKKILQRIPVYDIQSLGTTSPSRPDVVVEPFAAYLQVHPTLHLPHRHSFYHILLFTKGSGTHTIDFEQFAVQPGQIYFMIPGQVHSWNFKGAVDGYVINFSEQVFHSFLSNPSYLERFPFLRGVAADSVLHLSADIYRSAVDLLQTILEEVDKHGVFSDDLVYTYLLTLFIRISRDASVAEKHPAPQQNQLILFNFKKLVAQYYKEKRLPKEYAALLYITPNHLNAICQDLMGKSAGTIIRDRILLEAKRLLINAGLGIAEIAYQLDFADNSYFTKFFKKYTGVTPEAFRKAHLDHPLK